MPIIAVSKHGAITIPPDLRQKYGLDAGTKVVIVDFGDVLTFIPAFADPVRQAAGMLAGGPSLTEALLRERAQELSQ
jgi:bifunctional DNA-binding transcriptional regulator/antitoxin component of YhaV-PrlF toxin-antitoxin module